MTRRPMRLAATVLVAGLLFGVGTNALPVAAQADEASDLQAKVEQTSKDYNAATKHLEDVQADIDANQQKLDDLNAQMPELKREAASSINSSYKLSQSSNGLTTRRSTAWWRRASRRRRRRTSSPRRRPRPRTRRRRPRMP